MTHPPSQISSTAKNITSKLSSSVFFSTFFLRIWLIASCKQLRTQDRINWNKKVFESRRKQLFDSSSHPVFISRSHYVEEEVHCTSVYNRQTVQHDYFAIFPMCFRKKVLLKSLLLFHSSKSVPIILSCKQQFSTTYDRNRGQLTFASMRLPSLSRIVIPFTRYKLGSCSRKLSIESFDQ